MKIVADKNIPYVAEAFAEFGEVELVPGRRITSEKVADADILLVRTVTPVNEQLLHNSKVKFVGTATIGYDHIDIDYLKKREIGFSSAAGCNANSVAEYIVAALFVLADRYELRLHDMALGVIGVGNVGTKVVEKANILGMDVVMNDPPKKRETNDAKYKPLEYVLKESDIVTFHVPLTYEGTDATYRMGNIGLFNKMKEGSFVINTSRGAVIDTHACIHALYHGKIRSAVIDVWEDEPSIPTALLDCVDIGTPHIAGYSRDGKVNAARMLYRSACRHFNKKMQWEPVDLPPPDSPIIDVKTTDNSHEESIGQVVRQAYDIERDDRALRMLFTVPSNERAEYFDRLRNEYPVRREFHSMKVRLDTYDEGIVSKLQQLGFQYTNEYIEQGIKE